MSYAESEEIKMNLLEKMKELVDRNVIPGGCLRVHQHGIVVFEACVGYSNIEKRIPVETNTIYRMCSMTKLITATAVMQLEEQKELSLDDSIIKFFPGFPKNKEMITVRHLLTHSCSMGQSEISMKYYYKNLKSNDTWEERIAQWGEMPLDCPVGTSADYSPVIAYDLLGRIVEVVSGQRLGDYIHKYITFPLKMKDSSFELPLDKGERWATLYQMDKGKLVPAVDEIINRQTESGYDQGCGGLYSTLDDFDRFTEMLAEGGTLSGKQILKEETLWLMRTPGQITMDELRPGQRWGLGFLIFQHPEWTGRKLGHNTYGWSGAYGTHMYVDPVNDLCMTFMTGRKDIGGADSVASIELENIIFEIFCQT